MKRNWDGGDGLSFGRPSLGWPGASDKYRMFVGSGMKTVPEWLRYSPASLAG